MSGYEDIQARIERDRAKVLRRYPDAREKYLGPKRGCVVVAGEGLTFVRLASAPRAGDAWCGAALNIVEA